MNKQITAIAQEMCNLKNSFEKIYNLFDEEQEPEAQEAFTHYENMMKKLGEGFAFAIVSSTAGCTK